MEQSKMAGNEKLVTEFLVWNRNKIELKHLGIIQKIESPTSNGFVEIKSVKDISTIVTENAAKKADIYVNGKGISVKQSGAVFQFNRLQRAELLQTFKYLHFSNPDLVIKKIDSEVDLYHAGKLKPRSRPWQEMFSEKDFKSLLEFLMMKGSPNLGISDFPAKYILVAPSKNIKKENIEVYTFAEYYEKFFKQIKIAIRRQWIGQLSDDEHKRAVGIAKKIGNKKWVYKEISGHPRKKDGKYWRDDIPEKNRREVYMLSIEKVR